MKKETSLMFPAAAMIRKHDRLAHFHTLPALLSSGIKLAKNGAPAATRTRDPLLRRQMLYPTELRAQPVFVSFLLAKTLSSE